MIPLKQFKKGYYYYANIENPNGVKIEFIGKVIKNNKTTIDYRVVNGFFYFSKGCFISGSLHHKGVKEISKTKKGMFLYMI